LTITIDMCQDTLDEEVRNYRPGDEERIVSFLNSHSSWPASSVNVPKVDHWKWKFLSNPAGPELVCMIEVGCELVSYCASMPVRMNAGGREVLATQGVDLLTHPDYRGSGLMTKLLNHRDKLKTKRGIAFDFGFPNESSYHISTKREGFRVLDLTMIQHRFIIDRQGFFSKVNMGSLKWIGYSSYVALQRAVHRQGETDLIVQNIESFSETDDTLYHKVSSDFDLMAVRDHQFLNWRYCDPRGGSYIVRGVREDGKLLGYVVFKIESENQLIIADMLADPDRLEVISLLVTDVLNQGQYYGTESVICCLPKNHQYERSLREMGFVSKPRMTGNMPMRMIWFPRSSQDLSILSSPGPVCHIMLGDTDWA